MKPVHNMSKFELQAPFEPAGDQPQAIEALVDGLAKGKKHQVLMGVTGSGKTFTMANVIQEITPIISYRNYIFLLSRIFTSFSLLFNSLSNSRSSDSDL